MCLPHFLAHAFHQFRRIQIGHAAGYDQHAHFVPGRRVPGHYAAAAQHFIVRVGCYN